MPSHITPEDGMVAVIIVRALSLLTLWFRLRFKERHEQTHGRRVVAIMRSLRPGTHVEERRADGTWIRISCDDVQHEEGSDGRP
jgi:hypothetical protein